MMIQAVEITMETSKLNIWNNIHSYLNQSKKTHFSATPICLSKELLQAGNLKHTSFI